MGKQHAPEPAELELSSAPELEPLRPSGVRSAATKTACYRLPQGLDDPDRAPLASQSLAVQRRALVLIDRLLGHEPESDQIRVDLHRHAGVMVDLFPIEVPPDLVVLLIVGVTVRMWS